MEDTEDKQKMDLDAWKIRIDHRRNNRMKLQFNLNKEEATAFKQFSQLFIPLLAARKGKDPEKYLEEECLKDIFLQGFATLNNEFMRYMSEALKEHQDELAVSGITLVEGEDGMVTLSDSKVEEDADDEPTQADPGE